MDKMTYEKIQEKTYSMDYLIENFADHTIKTEKAREDMIKSFKENNPDQPLPDHMKDEFNVCKALLTLSVEIKRIAEELTDLSDTYYGYDS